MGLTNDAKLKALDQAVEIAKNVALGHQPIKPGMVRDLFKEILDIKKDIDAGKV